MALHATAFVAELVQDSPYPVRGSRSLFTVLALVWREGPKRVQTRRILA